MTNHPTGEAHKRGAASPCRIADLITVGVPGERVEALWVMPKRKAMVIRGKEALWKKMAIAAAQAPCVGVTGAPLKRMMITTVLQEAVNQLKCGLINKPAGGLFLLKMVLLLCQFKKFQILPQRLKHCCCLVGNGQFMTGTRHVSV